MGILPKRMSNYLRWRSSQSKQADAAYKPMSQRAFRLGEWLDQHHYCGIDVAAHYPASRISTVSAFAMVGWLNLADLTKNEVYRRKAEACLELVLEDQTAQGCWLFPYPFRKNAKDYPYSCENFMTLECLIQYANRTGQKDRASASVQKAIGYLLDYVGHDRGAFYYSAADKIRVPNISSMAARVFAESAALLQQPDHLELARTFARYCIGQQEDDGGYPYYEGQLEVCVPYHALETWELWEANKRLNDPAVAESVARAVQFLRRTLAQQGYATFAPSRGRSQVFKTAIWSAKAFLTTGFLEEAGRHLAYGLTRHSIPETGGYFYLLRSFFGMPMPIFSTPFIRYNASAFEICTTWLCATAATQSATKAS